MRLLSLMRVGTRRGNVGYLGIGEGKADMTNESKGSGDEKKKTYVQVLVPSEPLSLCIPVVINSVLSVGPSLRETAHPYS